MVDERKQVIVGPVQIFEHEHERPLLGEILEEAPPGGERLVALVAGAFGIAGEPDEGTQVRLDPGVGDCRELLFDRGGVVSFEDPELRLHHLPERPEGDAVPVGEAAALPPGDQVRPALDQLVELEHEPALADSGYADQGDELGRPLLQHAAQGVPEQIHLAAPPDQPGPVDALDARPGPRCERLPRRDGPGLALRLDRVDLPILDRPLGCPVGLLADDDLVGGRGGLEPGCGVDDVAGRERLPRLRPGLERDECLAGVDADPDLDAPLPAPVADRERRPNRSLGIVLVRDRRPEDRHHGVSDELLDRPAVPLELRAHATLVATELGRDVLGIHLLRARREADQVGEEHRDDLPLPARHAHARSLVRPPRAARRRGPGCASPRAATRSAPRPGSSVRRPYAASLSIGAGVIDPEHALHDLPHGRERIELAALHLVEQPAQLRIVGDRLLEVDLRPARTRPRTPPGRGCAGAAPRADPPAPGGRGAPRSAPRARARSRRGAPRSARSAPSTRARVSSASTERTSFSIVFAAGWSDLLIAITSGISMIPAFSAWIESPEPGIRTSRTVSATPITSTSLCPVPTVSRKTTSLPAASRSSRACSVASASPPRWPRVPIERMKTPGSRKWSARRIRSPSSAPCENGLDGSTETTPTVRSEPAHVAEERADQARLPHSGRPGDADRVRAAGARGTDRWITS